MRQEFAEACSEKECERAWQPDSQAKKHEATSRPRLPGKLTAWKRSPAGRPFKYGLARGAPGNVGTQHDSAVRAAISRHAMGTRRQAARPAGWMSKCITSSRRP